MFAAPYIYQDSKDNIKSTLPLKTNNSGRGLKRCSLDNFTQSADRLGSEKSVSKVNQSCSKISLGETENSKPKLNAQGVKASHKDFWTDDRKLMLESDSDYEDILSFPGDLYAFEPSDNESPPLKAPDNSRIGLEPCSLDNFTQPADRVESEKSVSKVDQSCIKISLKRKNSGKKENSKPKKKARGAKARNKDFWTDERTLMLESHSSYEGILSLLGVTSDIYIFEPSDNESPSPLKAPDVVFPDFSLPLPEFNCTLFECDDDVECFPMPDPEYIPMPDPEYIPMPDPEYIKMPDHKYIQKPDSEYIPMPDHEYIQKPDSEYIPMQKPINL